MKLAAEDIQNKALREDIQGLSGSEFLNKFIPNLIGLSFVIGILFFLFIILIGGVQWITSGGDKAGIEAARSKLVNAIIGIIILLVAFVFLKILEDFIGVDILQINLGELYIS